MFRWMTRDGSSHDRREVAVSSPGTLAATRITPPSGEPLIGVSMWSWWEGPHATAGGSWIFADASAHRHVSDLAVFVGRQHGHRILAAGDLNILRRNDENGSAYWAACYATAFDRMEAMGLPCIGPELPHARQADPWPDELPADSRNVPTFHSNRLSPTTAARQLDYVSASRELAGSMSDRALNRPKDWGPSDHCRIAITLAEDA